MTHAVRTGSTALGEPAGITREERRRDSEELLDEESLALLAILLAVSLEFGFGASQMHFGLPNYLSSFARPLEDRRIRHLQCSALFRVLFAVAGIGVLSAGIVMLGEGFRP